MQVVKRDGRLVDFDAANIERAVSACLAEDLNEYTARASALPVAGPNIDVGPMPFDMGERLIEAVARDVAKDVEQAVRQLATVKDPTIEQIQQAVIKALLAVDPAAAVRYAEYKGRHDAVRARDIPPEVRAAFETNKKWFPTLLQLFQFYDKYSRWIQKLGRREVWEESIDRVMQQFGAIVRQRGSAFKYVGDRVKLETAWSAAAPAVSAGMLSMEAMSSMRMLAMAGPAFERNNATAFNCSYAGINNPYTIVEFLVLLMAGCGCGFSVERQFIDQLPAVKEDDGLGADDHETWVYGGIEGDIHEPITHHEGLHGRRVHVVEDSSEGWASALSTGICRWWSGLDDLDFDFSEVRPAGAKLLTKGGTASGPEPLRKMLAKVRTLILSARGRKLTSIEVYDLVCTVADCVVCGGVRRSSLLCMFDWDDRAMRDAKSGNWMTEDHEDYAPWRQNSNNSAVTPDRRMTQAEVAGLFVDMERSGSGEPAFISRRAGRLTMPEQRRANLSEQMMQELGFNPCVTGDTWVMTTDGPRQVTELIDTPFTAVVDGKPYECKTGFWQTGENPTMTLTTAGGHKVRATGNHKFMVVASRTQHALRQEWRRLDEIKPGDEVMLHNHRDGAWDGEGTSDEGWLLGSLFGDGTFAGATAYLDYWGDTRYEMRDLALDTLRRTVPCRSDMAGCDGTPTEGGVEKVRIGSAGLRRLAAAYGMISDAGTKKAPDIERCGSSFWCGYLRGWFDADGSVQGTQNKGVSVRLHSKSLDALRTAQRALARMGIVSSVYENRRPEGDYMLPDGHGGTALYHCQAQHDLVVANDNIGEFARRVGFSEREKAEALDEALSSYKRAPNRERFFTKVVAVESAATESVYDCTVLEAHRFDANGLVAHNCVEILLRNMGFCNLTIVVARPGDTLEDLKRKVRLATIIGTLQACGTKFRGLRKEWTQNAEEERLLGVDITNQQQRPMTPAELAALKTVVLETNREWSSLLGIPMSAAMTCNKPSGNSSVLFNCSPGINAHPGGAQNIRNVTVGAATAMYKVLAAAGVPMAPKTGEDDGNVTQWIASFPQKADNPDITTSVPALEQLAIWENNKDWWCEHNPSTTITFSKNELIDVAQWMYECQDKASGLSFFPKWEGGNTTVYKNLPCVPLTPEEYEEFAAGYPDIDFALLYAYETEDETTSASELACSGGQCLTSF